MQSTLPARTSSESSIPKPRLFALIIGINIYKSSTLQSLRGAQPDAVEFVAYLENDLLVPSDQIILLLNEEATRSNIIKGFDELAADPRIEKGDPVVIYYAGHGSEIAAHPNWESGGPNSKIQMIVPYDYSTEPGHAIKGLPDRIIGSLIDRISESKGDNITAIFDCCNSASGTRSVNGDDFATLVRSVELQPGSYDPEPDRHLWDTGTRSAKRTDQLRHAGLQSHMLIAACGASELAKESEGRGAFSTAFLKLLQAHSPDKLRYCDILTHMDSIPSQNPQCEGVNQHRILFNAKVVPPVRRFFPIEFKDTGEPPSRQLILGAGSAQGITDGAEFNVYLSSDTKFENAIGSVTVSKATAFTSTMILASNLLLSHPSVAVQTKAGIKEDFRLFIPSRDPFHDTYKAICEDEANAKYNLHNITLVKGSQRGIAHLQASMKNGQVMLEMMDERVTQYGFKRQFNPGNATCLDTLARVLDRTAHFYRELNRANSNCDITSRIHIEFYELAETHEKVDEVEFGEYRPVGSNLCNGNIVDFVIKENTPYGLKLINDTKYNFYPYLFYFDNSDLSISSYYEAPSATAYVSDVPLKHNGTLTLGYGSGGVTPFTYALGEGQDIDVGFLKLSLTTQPIDLSYIPQPSPFESTRSMAKFSPPTEKWETVLIPIIQRRYPLGSAESRGLDGHGLTIGGQSGRLNTVLSWLWPWFVQPSEKQ